MPRPRYQSRLDQRLEKDNNARTDVSRKSLPKKNDDTLVPDITFSNIMPETTLQELNVSGPLRRSSRLHASILSTTVTTPLKTIDKNNSSKGNSSTRNLKTAKKKKYANENLAIEDEKLVTLTPSKENDTSSAKFVTENKETIQTDEENQGKECEQSRKIDCILQNEPQTENHTKSLKKSSKIPTLHRTDTKRMTKSCAEGANQAEVATLLKDDNVLNDSVSKSLKNVSDREFSKKSAKVVEQTDVDEGEQKSEEEEEENKKENKQSRKSDSYSLKNCKIVLETIELPKSFLKNSEVQHVISDTEEEPSSETLMIRQNIKRKLSTVSSDDDESNHQPVKNSEELFNTLLVKEKSILTDGIVDRSSYYDGTMPSKLLLLEAPPTEDEVGNFQESAIPESLTQRFEAFKQHGNPKANVATIKPAEATIVPSFTLEEDGTTIIDEVTHGVQRAITLCEEDSDADLDVLMNTKRKQSKAVSNMMSDPVFCDIGRSMDVPFIPQETGSFDLVIDSARDTEESAGGESLEKSNKIATSRNFRISENYSVFQEGDQGEEMKHPRKSKLQSTLLPSPKISADAAVGTGPSLMQKSQNTWLQVDEAELERSPARLVVVESPEMIEISPEVETQAESHSVEGKVNVDCEVGAENHAEVEAENVEMSSEGVDLEEELPPEVPASQEILTSIPEEKSVDNDKIDENALQFLEEKFLLLSKQQQQKLSLSHNKSQVAKTRVSETACSISEVPSIAKRKDPFEGRNHLSLLDLIDENIADTDFPDLLFNSSQNLTTLQPTSQDRTRTPSAEPVLLFHRETPRSSLTGGLPYQLGGDTRKAEETTSPVHSTKRTCRISRRTLFDERAELLPELPPLTSIPSNPLKNFRQRPKNFAIDSSRLPNSDEHRLETDFDKGELKRIGDDLFQAAAQSLIKSVPNRKKEIEQLLENLLSTHQHQMRQLMILLVERQRLRDIFEAKRESFKETQTRLAQTRECIVETIEKVLPKTENNVVKFFGFNPFLFEAPPPEKMREANKRKAQEEEERLLKKNC